MNLYTYMYFNNNLDIDSNPYKQIIYSNHIDKTLSLLFNCSELMESLCIIIYIIIIEEHFRVTSVPKIKENAFMYYFLRSTTAGVFIYIRIYVYSRC